MLVYIGIGLAIFIVGYFVGANNPLASVKKKIIAGAQSAANAVSADVNKVVK